VNDTEKMLFEALKDAHRLRRKVSYLKRDAAKDAQIHQRAFDERTELLHRLHRKIRNALDETSFATLDNAEAALDRLIAKYKEKEQ
jgi:ribosome-associated translation inhibitor RaiA